MGRTYDVIRSLQYTQRHVCPPQLSTPLPPPNVHSTTVVLRLLPRHADAQS